MNNTRLDRIADKLVLIFTTLHVKMIKMVREESAENPSRSYYQVLGILMKNSPLPVSEIGNRLGISRPNMTSLIDRLIDERMVVRLPDKKDRRVINIAITDTGKRFIEENIAIVKGKIKKSLSRLDDGEIKVLLSSLENVERALSRIGEDETKEKTANIATSENGKHET